MGTTLTGTQIQDTYESLIKVSDNTTIGGTLKQLSDGEGNDLPIKFTTGSTVISGSLDLTSADITGLPASMSIDNNVDTGILTATGTDVIETTTGFTFTSSIGMVNKYDSEVWGDSIVRGEIINSGSIVQRYPNASNDYNGVIHDWGSFPAAPTIGLVYYWSGTNWIVAANTSEAAVSGVLMISTDTSSSPRMLANGIIQATIYGFTTGQKLYIGTSGALTATPPTAAGTFVRHVGWSVDGSNRKIYFNPDNSYYENT